MQLFRLLQEKVAERLSRMESQINVKGIREACNRETSLFGGISAAVLNLFPSSKIDECTRFFLVEYFGYSKTLQIFGNSF